MKEQIREKLKQSLAVARQTKNLLDTLPPKTLVERAAEFSEGVYQIARYAKQALKASGDELAELMYCLGGLTGSLQYQIYELTSQQEARRRRNRHLAHLQRIRATLDRYEQLQPEYGSNKARSMLAAELGISERQVANRLAFAMTKEQQAELEQAVLLPWFAEYCRLLDRYWTEQDEENFW